MKRKGRDYAVVDWLCVVRRTGSGPQYVWGGTMVRVYRPRYGQRRRKGK